MRFRAAHGVDHYRDLILKYKARRAHRDRETVVDAWYRFDFEAVVEDGSRAVHIHDDLGFFFQKNSGTVRSARLDDEVYYKYGVFSLTEKGGCLADSEVAFNLTREDLRRYVAWSQQLLRENIAMMRSLKDSSVVLSKFSELGEVDLVHMEREFLCDLEPAFSAAWRT
ncbi:hypothetical protein QO010_002045 [Caulobacter ginsengisoli]|uniref:Uncharacterized protein n=1 Tax=Caulobacter ginsengisoli TaxID=400775 RepID=A0ABU0IT93_9CAUL|nr:hypothetical protein [Caulobacter ginsengisoli]MDQ0464264.1 hypothetical protein [Caulobacter ginsengisoli]